MPQKPQHGNPPSKYLWNSLSALEMERISESKYKVEEVIFRLGSVAPVSDPGHILRQFIDHFMQNLQGTKIQGRPPVVQEQLYEGRKTLVCDFRHETHDFITGLVDDELVVVKRKESPKPTAETLELVLEAYRRLAEAEKDGPFARFLSGAISVLASLEVSLTMSQGHDNRRALNRFIAGTGQDPNLKDLSGVPALVNAQDAGRKFFGLDVGPSHRTDLNISLDLVQRDAEAAELFRWNLWWKICAPSNNSYRLLSVRQTIKTHEEYFPMADSRERLFSAETLGFLWGEATYRQFLETLLPRWLRDLW
jgi:hypothetical protein